MPIEMHLEQLAPDVYACLQPDRGLGCSNSGLVNRGGGLVVDTFWDLPHTRELIAQYQRVWRAPARRVVNTHANGDHCWGNQLFEGAEIIGHRLCAEEFKSQDPAALQARITSGWSGQRPSAFSQRLAGWDFSGITLTPPTTLAEDRMSLDLGGIPVEIVYAGPAHTMGDVIIHLPKQRVLFAGDILFRLCTPLGWDGSNQKWLDALDMMVSLQPQVIVPGHGPLCGVEGPKEQKAYLQYVWGEAKRHFEAGRSELEAARRIDLGPYASWTEPERIVLVVARAYRELRGDPMTAPLTSGDLTSGMMQLAADPKFQRAKAQRSGETPRSEPGRAALRSDQEHSS